MLDTPKEVACTLIATLCTVIDRSSALSAVGGAAGGGVIMPFRVAKAFGRYRLTKRQNRPRFKYYLENICERPMRFLSMNERS